MANAAKMIDETGEIHISHKCNHFFQQWGLQKLGEKNGLVLIKEVKFELSDYPGYNTKYGYGGDKNFDCNPSRTYKFRLKDRQRCEAEVEVREVEGASMAMDSAEAAARRGVRRMKGGGAAAIDGHIERREEMTGVRGERRHEPAGARGER
ncbi:hypothetical protein Scep_013583 [Stephania cephalantha]|uniref:25S rRNA (uridine-N(3))-methyltransferase BMT5-like domain-containing protein n=1 Tax=Stephania cephalantha TaxID=152367 RepID=A0AAP0JJE5_9MAGN